jgi:hypothetical protein
MLDKALLHIEVTLLKEMKVRLNETNGDYLAYKSEVYS